MHQMTSGERVGSARHGWRRVWLRPRRPRLQLSRLLVATLLVGVSVLAACAPEPQSTTMPNVTLTAKDFAFEMPERLPGGLVSITFDNQGKEPHQANLARLHDGVTREQLQQAMQGPPEQALSLVSFVGGPNIVDPGMHQTVVVDLPAGQYVAICFIASPDGHSHVEKGMTTFFTVDAPASEQPAAPTTSELVTLKDFAIEVPETLSPGATTWKVWNNGSQPHEVGLMRLAEGKTMSDLEAFMQDPSGDQPFAYVGGMAALDPGKSAWVTLTLEPGEYVGLCFVPDPSTGKAHMELGMMQSFTVH